MLRRSSVFSLFVLAVAACSPDVVTDVAGPLKLPSASRQMRSVDAAAGDYLVLMRGNSIGRTFQETVKTLGGSITSFHTAAGFATVSGLTADAAATLASTAGIAEVQPDVEIRIDSPVMPAVPDAVQVGEPAISSVANPAGAYFYPFQWNLRAIGANRAWAAGKLGSNGVTVAIVDSGIDYDAYDLNGLVDLGRSTSFVASDNAIRTTYFSSRNAVSDFNGHGTNVATQVSSKAVLFAGVTSQTKLIGVKVIGWNGAGTLGAVLNGVLYAADAGANVANMSLGGAFNKPGLGVFVSIINRVLNYANQKGMLIVVAAGNALPPDYIPVDLQHNGNEYNTYCDAPHVICVAATGPITNNGDVNIPAWYSYYGRGSISVAGPGGNYDIVNPGDVTPFPWGDAISWIFSACSKTLILGLKASGEPILHNGCKTGLQGIGEIGTSQAAPHVAGLAALLMAKYGTGQPSLIKNRIEQSVNPLSAIYEGAYGRGVISVTNALGL